MVTHISCRLCSNSADRISISAIVKCDHLENVEIDEHSDDDAPREALKVMVDDIFSACPNLLQFDVVYKKSKKAKVFNMPVNGALQFFDADIISGRHVPTIMMINTGADEIISKKRRVREEEEKAPPAKRARKQKRTMQDLRDFHEKVQEFMMGDERYSKSRSIIKASELPEFRMGNTVAWKVHETWKEILKRVGEQKREDVNFLLRNATGKFIKECLSAQNRVYRRYYL